VEDWSLIEIWTLLHLRFSAQLNSSATLCCRAKTSDKNPRTGGVPFVEFF
jgi:hypothetical protein